MERNAAVLRHARLSGLDVFAAGLDSMRAEPLFNLIVLFKVLEHLLDPQ